LIRQIRSLLYENGFTIGGAKQQLQEQQQVSKQCLDKKALVTLRNDLEDVLDILE
jgi:DNA-binding transcriptional MerR regulator